MNSKERVIASLERRKIDRVPFGLSCGAGPEYAGDKLRLHFKVDTAEELLLKIGVDFRDVGPHYVGPPQPPVFGLPGWIKGVPRSSISDEFGGTYSDNLGVRPLQKCTTVKEVADYPWPEVEWFSFDELKEDCRRQSKYAVRLGRWNPILSGVFHLFGIQTTLANVFRRPDLVREAIGRITDFYYDLFDAGLSSAEGAVDIVGFGDDFASQHDLMMNLEMWRSLCKPSLARLFSLGKKYGVYVYFHSCGAVRRIIPDLIEMGLDILYPVQPRARGMNSAELKREFGDRLAFWGGIDVQKTLPFGTPDDVRREVREQIKTLGAGGGYIMDSSHVMHNIIPLENILAMYDEAIKTRPS